jgi:hypothetical protein
VPVLVLIVLAAFVAGGGTAVVSTLTGKARVIAALRNAAIAAGLNPNIVQGIGKVESSYNLAAVNNAGRDGEYGGAWGPTQITERTARRNGYTGPMRAFTEDPELAAEWTCRLLKPGARNAEGDVLDHELVTPEEYGAWWNGGELAPEDVDPLSSAIGYMAKLSTAVKGIA